MTERSTVANNWTQTVAIIIAGCWALYQFIYIEHLKPLTEYSILNVDVNLLNLGEVSVINSESPLIAYRMIVTANNPGKIKQFIATSYFQIFGDSILIKESVQNLDNKKIEEVLNTSNQHISKIYNIKSSELIHTGTVYNSNSSFNPGETISVERMIYLPSTRYSQIEAVVFILSGPDIRKIKIKHSVEKQSIVNFLVSENNQEWFEFSTNEGIKLIGEKLTLSKANKLLPNIVKKSENMAEVLDTEPLKGKNADIH